MCGITGFIDFSQATSQVVLDKMTDALIHRGPDGRGTLLKNIASSQVGLGHRRLAILDLSEDGAQPMAFQNLHISFNGEIYNFSEIKAELESLDRVFRSQTDTEVILQAFHEWGPECVHKFIGFFVFALFNESERKLYIFRDRTGVKPLFYYASDSLFLFGSELKGVLAHPRFTRKLNLDSVASFMQFGHVPTPNCIYQDTFKLSPGHFLTVDLSKSSLDIQIQKYWCVEDYYNRPKLDISLQEAKKEVKQLLKSAFKYRMVSDVPVGVFLSGGYDSACVAALLQEDAKDSLHTYTISVPDIGLNEADFAKQTAEYLGTRHRTIDCTERDALNIIPELPHFYDEPFADSSAIPTLLLSRFVKQEITVALSADGGDELFAGYNRHDYLMKYGKTLHRLPGAFRLLLAGGMNKIPADKIPFLRNKYNFPNRYEKLKHLLRNPSAENMMLQLSRQFDDRQVQKLFKHKIQFQPNAYTRSLDPQFKTELSSMLNIDYQTYLVDDILQKVDRATMAASLEGREPFLDHRLIEYIAQLPDEFKYRAGSKKFLLKEIVHDYIPKAMMDRPKMGFAIPIEKWMMNELKPLVEESFDEQMLQKQGLFNIEPLQQMKTQFLNGKTELGFKIWYFVCFQQWYKTYYAS